MGKNGHGPKWLSAEMTRNLLIKKGYIGSVRGFPMVPLVNLPLVANGTTRNEKGGAKRPGTEKIRAKRPSQ